MKQFYLSLISVLFVSAAMADDTASFALVNNVQINNMPQNIIVTYEIERLGLSEGSTYNKSDHPLSQEIAASELIMIGSDCNIHGASCGLIIDKVTVNGKDYPADTYCEKINIVFGKTKPAVISLSSNNLLYCK